MHLLKSTYAAPFLTLVVMAVTLATGAWAAEQMCPTVHTTCQGCIAVGCGWTADDGDCLKSCAEVDDGAACVSKLIGKCPTLKPTKKPTKKYEETYEETN
jgi:hypothetical protein